MPDLLIVKHPLQDANVINALADGIQSTLHEMAHFDCVFEKAFVQKDWKPLGDGTGVLEMKTDQFRGYLLVHFPKEAILEIVGNMIGESLKEFNDEVLDGVGEITNIVYGSMKAKLNPLGYEFKMASPKAEYTQQFKYAEKPSKQLIIPVKVNNWSCYIEVALI